MKVDDAHFEMLAEPPIPEWVMLVTIEGEGFEDRAVPFAARVGDVPVEGLLIHLDGNGFSGYLSSVPPRGSPLLIGYLDGDLIDTGIDYQPPIA